MRATRKVGQAVEVAGRDRRRRRRCDFQRSSKLAETVTSVTGRVELAVLDQEAAGAAREVAGDGVEAEAHHLGHVEAALDAVEHLPRRRRAPRCRMKFDVVTCGAPPTPRPAQPFDARPSLRASRCRGGRCAGRPPSTTRFLRDGRPSPSKGREPGARGISGSSTMVTSGDATSRALAIERGSSTRGRWRRRRSRRTARARAPGPPRDRTPPAARRCRSSRRPAWRRCGAPPRARPPRRARADRAKRSAVHQ